MNGRIMVKCSPFHARSLHFDIYKQKRRKPKLYGIISKPTFVNDARVIGNIIR